MSGSKCQSNLRLRGRCLLPHCSAQRSNVVYLSLKASSGSRWTSFPAVSSAPTSTSLTATTTPWAFSPWVVPNPERVADIGKNVRSGGGHRRLWVINALYKHRISFYSGYEERMGRRSDSHRDLDSPRAHVESSVPNRSLTVGGEESQKREANGR